MAQKNLEFDARRLVALERQRQAKRAIVRGLNDTLQELRERRTDVQRRSQVARMNGEHSDPRGRDGYLTEASRLEAEIATISQRMTDTQAQIDEMSAEAAAAGSVAKAALAFAVEKKIEIPAELAEAAHRITVGSHPTGISVKGQ